MKIALAQINPIVGNLKGNSEIIKWFKKTQWEAHPVKIVELKNRYIMNSVPYKELRDNGIPKTKTEQIVDYK